MDQVARRARISRALLYVYFSDRTDLQFGLCERGLGVLTTRFEEAAAAAPHRARADRRDGPRLRGVFAGISRVFRSPGALPGAGSRGRPCPTGSVGACLAAGERVHQIMFAAIEAGQRDGSIERAAPARRRRSR